MTLSCSDKGSVYITRLKLSEADRLELSEPEMAELVAFVLSGQAKLLRLVANETLASVAKQCFCSPEQIRRLENGFYGWQRADPRTITVWYRLVKGWRDRYGEVEIAVSEGLPEWRS